MKGILDKFRQAAGYGNQSLDEVDTNDSIGYKILFVCMGNICRSPTAEGAFRRELSKRAPSLSISVDSAGTHAYHIGAPPDHRAQRAAEARGIDLSEQRARKVGEQDFAEFDLVLAMDELNVEILRELCPPEYHERIKLFLDYAPHLGRRDVPDPYYGGANGFELVLDLVEDASAALLTQLRETESIES